MYYIHRKLSIRYTIPYTVKCQPYSSYIIYFFFHFEINFNTLNSFIDLTNLYLYYLSLY